MKKILIIAFSDLENDPRVKRQIKYLSQYYNVSTVGWEPLQIQGVEFYRIKPIKRSRLCRIKRAFRYKLRHFEEIYWSLYDFLPLLKILSKKKFDLILTNDVDTLPFAIKIANNAKVVLDAHEYSPRHFENQFLWRFFFQDFNKYLCSKYMHRCDKTITVSKGIADEYKKDYKIDPIVITNAADYVDLDPSGIDKEHIRIITHGIANPSRKLELMIKIMDHMDQRFHLDMMLVPSYPGYYKYLQRLALKRKNVSIIPPVKQKEIISSTNSYDLSFLIIKPDTINLKYGLWNKTFESLQARLGLVTGVSPEPQAEIVNKFGCGIVLDSFEPKSIALQLNQLSAKKIFEFKINANIAAGKLTAQTNMVKLGKIINNLIGK